MAANIASYRITSPLSEHDPHCNFLRRNMHHPSSETNNVSTPVGYHPGERWDSLQRWTRSSHCPVVFFIFLGTLVSRTRTTNLCIVVSIVFHEQDPPVRGGSGARTGPRAWPASMNGSRRAIVQCTRGPACTVVRCTCLQRRELTRPQIHELHDCAAPQRSRSQ